MQSIHKKLSRIGLVSVLSGAALLGGCANDRASYSEMHDLIQSRVDNGALRYNIEQEVYSQVHDLIQNSVDRDYSLSECSHE